MLKNHFIKPIQKDIPDVIKEYKQWIAWKNKIRGDKLIKIPYNTDTGSRAKSNDIKAKEIIKHLDSYTEISLLRTGQEYEFLLKFQSSR